MSNARGSKRPASVGLPRNGRRLLALACFAAAGNAHAEDFMSMSLEQLLEVDVGVASRVNQRADRQPVSVSVIGREQIRTSGARTLNELLLLHVPGYFLVEDQDDTIAGMRGLAPDNNSKMMLLLDGRSLNADWFWGPPDALLNGLDIEFIERIEVVRGPGSVTQGQGALLGVINIVTIDPGNPATHAVALHGGEHGRLGGSWHWRWNNGSDRSARLYASDGRFDGEPVRNEGLAQQVEQGLSVFERNHHLKRADYRHLLADYRDGALWLRGYRFDQRRDLYNWRRDREQVRQVLTGVQASWRRAAGPGELTVEAHADVDDYFLRSHGNTRDGAGRALVPGLTMGGHRETRTGLRTLWASNHWLPRQRVAIGAELNHYRSGLANADGDNFIVNTQQAVLERGFDALNAGNRWSLPGETTIRSLFAEDFIALAPGWELFAAARWDDHPDWGSEITPRLGLIWQQGERSQWRLGWQSGFRGAVGVHYSGGFEGDGLLRQQNFDQVEANPFFAAVGAQDLEPVEPEHLSSLELAWQYRGERLQVQAVVFHNVLRNVIGVGSYFIDDPALRAQAIAGRTMIGDDVIGDWGGVFYFQNNPGELSHRGLEVEAEYRIDTLGLLLRASQSVVKVDDADAGQFGPGNIYVTGHPDEPGSRSFPENVSRLHAVWTPPRLGGRWSIGYTHLYYTSWLPPARLDADGQPFAEKLPGDQFGNLAVEWRPTAINGLSLSLQVKNLWDAGELWPTASVAGEGESNLGVPALERRSAWLTARYRF